MTNCFLLPTTHSLRGNARATEDTGGCRPNRTRLARAANAASTLGRQALSWLPAVLLLGAVALPARADSAQTYLDCLLDFQTYGDSIWHSASYSNAPPDAGYWGDGNSTGNGGIRGSCGVAVAYAVLARAYPADANRPARLAKIRQALNYAANTHLSGTNVCVDSLPWGHGWQTALWAGSMGLACILVQNDLSAGTVQAVQRAVADEATYRAGVAPASGYVSDTKAEENGWNSNIPALAAAWLSTNANAGLWLTCARKYLANTYTVANTTGDPLASWITTVTLYPDFALENHGFYHPTYQMVAGMSMGDSLLMARLANPSIATQLQAFAEHNVLNVWLNENHLVLDSGDFAAPAGLDWELHDYEQNSYIAWLASHFNDPLARWTDARLAQLVRYRQVVNGDGRFVGPSGGGFYREAVEARRTAIAWLHWANADYPAGATSAPANAFEHLPDVGIIAQRGSFGFASICYGPQTNGSSPRIMAFIEPPALSVPTNAFVATPLQPGIIGLGALGNPTGGRLVSLATNDNGFQAELQLTNGLNGTTEVYVNCTGETIGIVEVPSPVGAGSSSSAGSFSVGVENDPLIGGSRLIEWAGGTATITNRSGVSRNLTNSWLCVAGRYGLAAGPAGYFNYQAASSYNRLGAAQDTLQFKPQSPLGPRYAVWFPGKSAAQTAAGASAIAWTNSGTNVVLTFPGLGGSPVQITAGLPPALPNYPPYSLAVAGVTASSWQTNFPPTNVVDSILSDYWVSLYGPTNHAEWLKVTFPRFVAISEFQIYPRTDNGGYGPQGVQLVLNVTNTIPADGIPTSGSNVYQGTMAPTSMLDVPLAHPMPATNAVLVITSAYDRGSSASPRNVQVNECLFFERAQPGTYGDWALSEFTDAQMADPAFGAPGADPDEDSVSNLAEFAMAGNPLLADSAAMALKPLASPSGTFAFSFRERQNLSDVQRHFERSSNLVDWVEVVPLSLAIMSNLTNAYVRTAVFPDQDAAAYYRLRFLLPSGH